MAWKQLLDLGLCLERTRRCRLAVRGQPTLAWSGFAMTRLQASYLAVPLLAASVAAPQQPALRPRLAIIEKVASQVGFYTHDGHRLGGVPVGPVPHEMALDPSGRWLYVTDNGILWMTDPGQGGHTISIVDLAQRRKAGTIDLLPYRRPHGIDVDPTTGRLAVTVENPDGLLLVDPQERRVLRFYDTRGSDPHMVRLDREGHWAYVSNTGSGTVAAIHLATGHTKLLPTGSRPQGAARSPDGRWIYVTNSGEGSITIVDTRLQQVAGQIRTGQGPNRIAVAPDGDTLVYSMREGTGAVGFASVSARREIGRVSLPGTPLSLGLSRDGSWA